MKTQITLSIRLNHNQGGLKIKPRSKVLLSGALIALAAVMLLAGASAFGMFKMPAVAVSSVQVHNSQPLPFGPGWAATYGVPSERVGKAALPFGPGWAANYGTPSERVSKAALPFGPGWAATYGVPAH